MPRVQFSDVTPPEKKRSIRDIPIPNGGKRKVPIVIKPQKEEVVSEVTEKRESGPYEYYYPKDKSEPGQAERTGGKKKNKYIFGGIAFIAVIVFIIGMMTLFASASINIVPKSQAVDVNIEIAGTNEPGENVVRYEVVKLSKSKTASVPATGEEMAEIKASGKIIIYNNFSSEPQRLIVRTRFESPEGLIYRIPESIMVPGKTTKSGVETPGSIEVEVFADEAGEKYNIKKTDFTIPGFKSDAARYKNFYARSATDMTGGFVGNRKTVLPSEKEAALQNIITEVQADLKKELESKVPNGLVLLSGSIYFESKELPYNDGGSSVTMGKDVTAYAMMLNVQDLTDRIIEEYVSNLPEWTNIKPTIKNFSLLNVANAPNNLETGKRLDLQINGNVVIWADIDEELINQRLLGAPKRDAAKLIDEFAGISSITATIRPIWKQSFPENPLKIHVQAVYNR